MLYLLGINGPSHEILVHIAYAQIPLRENANTDVSSSARDLIVGRLSFHLHSIFVYESTEGSSKSLQILWLLAM